MIEVDELENHLAGYNFTGLVPAPWGHLAKIENQTIAMRKSIGDVEGGRENFKEIVQKTGAVKKRVNDAQALLKGATYLEEKINKSSDAMDDIVENGDKVLKEIDDLFQKLKGIQNVQYQKKSVNAVFNLQKAGIQSARSKTTG